MNLPRRFLSTGPVPALALMLALAWPVAVPAQPADAPTGVLEAELLLLRGETGAGIRRYLELGRQSDTLEPVVRATQLAMATELPALALEGSEEWLRRSPTDAEARRIRDEARLALGQWQALAREATQEIRRTDPLQRGQAIDTVMLRLMEAEDAAAATQVAVQLTKDWANAPEVWAGLAQVAANAGLTTRAKSALAALASLRSLTAEEEFLRLRVLAAHGEHAEVLSALGSPKADEPPGPRLLRAQLLLAGKDEVKIAAALADLLQSPRLRAIGLRLLAGRELRAGRYAEAERLYGELDTLSPKEGEGALGLANVARARGDLAAAAERYGRLQEGPQALAAQAALWRLRREQGDALTAASGFDRFLAENPEQRMDGLALRIGLLTRAGEGAKAVSLAEAALRAFPGHVGLSQGLASALDQVGRHRESLQWYAARSRARPWDPEALNNHAYQLALAGEQLGLALRMAEQAVAERPVAAYFDTLGWVYYRRGQLPLARQWLEKALALGPEPEISAHLGEVLWAQGERDAALQAWRDGLAGAAPEDRSMLRAAARRVSGQEL